MQILITVNDPENGLGSGTEKAFTDQVTQMVGVWDRFPGITATAEVHEEDVYGEPNRDRFKEYVVDLYVPFACVVPDAETAEDAEGMARAAFIGEGLYERMVELLDDTVFSRSDSGWRTEVGEA